jgi:hypothetical protein
MNNYYIYEWFIVDTDEVFYVGKGKERRAETVSGRNKFFKDMYNTHNCNFRIKIDNLKEDEAFKYERALIKYYREHYPEYRLTNQTDGGEGVSGWKPDEEWKKKQGELSKKRWEDEDFRRKMIEIRTNEDSVYKSEEFRNKISDIVKGENNPNYAHYWTKEMKNHAREIKLGKYDGENNPNYGNYWSEEKKKKFSEFMKNNGLKNEEHGMAKRVVCLETGEIFKCIKFAKEKYNNNVGILNRSRVTIKAYHFKEIDDDYVVNKEKLWEELIVFYKNCKCNYNIFLCKEDNKFYYGYPELQKETGLGLKKIKRILKESSEIFINNKTYIIIK